MREDLARGWIIYPTEGSKHPLENIRLAAAVA